MCSCMHWFWGGHQGDQGGGLLWLCLVWRVLEPELCSMLHCRESTFVLNSSTFAEHAAVSVSSPSDIKLTQTAISSQDCDHMTEAACNLTCAISPYSTATKCMAYCAAPTSHLRFIMRLQCSCRTQ